MTLNEKARSKVTDKGREAADRYRAAAHKMQTGVEFLRDKSSQEPKQLRVGINSAHSDIASLMSLMVDKGIATMDEILEALAEGMEEEAENYAEAVAAELPDNGSGKKPNVTLL